MLFDTDLVSLVDPRKLPVVRLLSQVVKVAVRQLSAFSGNLHCETGRDTVGALTIHQGESLEVPWWKDWGHLKEHIWKYSQAFEILKILWKWKTVIPRVKEKVHQADRCEVYIWPSRFSSFCPLGRQKLSLLLLTQQERVGAQKWLPTCKDISRSPASVTNGCCLGGLEPLTAGVMRVNLDFPEFRPHTYCLSDVNV